MKKLLLCSLLASTLVYGEQRAWEFGVNGGMTSIKNKDTINLEKMELLVSLFKKIEKD